MKPNLKLFLIILIGCFLVFTACKDDNPTTPNNNDPVVTDPNPPDYPSFVRACFNLYVQATKQYSTYSIDEAFSVTPTWSMLGSFSGGTFYADTTTDWGQYEELTITIDTLTGIMTNLEYHRTYSGETIRDMSVSLSGMSRTYQSYNSIAFEDSGATVCTKINSLDYSYQDIAHPNYSYVITEIICEDWSSLEVSLSNY